MHSACILEHSETFCIHSVTFWNILHTYWSVLGYSAYILEHSACILGHSACILRKPVRRPPPALRLTAVLCTVITWFYVWFLDQNTVLYLCLPQLHSSSLSLEHSASILKHTTCILEHLILNILEHFGTFCYYIKCCNVRRWNFNFATDGHTLGFVELRHRS